jgi:hypothetical protein
MRRYNHINQRRAGDVTHDVPVSFATRLMTALTVECCLQYPDPHIPCPFFGSELRLTWVSVVKSAEQMAGLTHGQHTNT